jgi:hypothetical protein
MKKIFSIALTLSCVALVNQSCSKQKIEADTVRSSPDQTINAVVGAGGIYTLDVTNTETVSISKQAAHFATSSTEKDAKDGKLIYKYVPENGFAGQDAVELRTTKIVQAGSSTGNGCNSGNNNHSVYNTTSVTSIVINFTVTK